MRAASVDSIGEYRFCPEHLRVGARQPGISAFMRIRNGADFLERAIRSHIAHFDEIVAVYNQCTDATPDILARLQQQYGPRLQVIHYLPAVFPPGSPGHAKEPPDSPSSLVNYYNFALARTRFAIATKLDDDHLAIEPALARVVSNIRANNLARREMLCFSGPNLARDDYGRLGILAREPFSGGGDIGFFRVTPTTYFLHDRRFERFQRTGLRRRFGGFLYWHLKYLKAGFGFTNYQIDNEDNSRYGVRLRRYLADRRVVGANELRASIPHTFDRLVRIPKPEKLQLRVDRWLAFRDNGPSDDDLSSALATLCLRPSSSTPRAAEPAVAGAD